MADFPCVHTHSHYAAKALLRLASPNALHYTYLKIMQLTNKPVKVEESSFCKHIDYYFRKGGEE